MGQSMKPVYDVFEGPPPKKPPEPPKYFLKLMPGYRYIELVLVDENGRTLAYLMKFDTQEGLKASAYHSIQYEYGLKLDSHGQLIVEPVYADPKNYKVQL